MRAFLLLAALLLACGCIIGPARQPSDAQAGVPAQEGAPDASGQAGPAAAPTPQKETSFSTLTDGDFSIDYPDWPNSTLPPNGILSLQDGPCVLNVNRFNSSLDPVFGWVVNNTASNPNITILGLDSAAHSVEFLAPYQNITFRARYAFSYCNFQTYMVGATCAESYRAAKETELERFLSSASCAKAYEPPSQEAPPALPDLRGTNFTRFVEGDYAADLPNWQPADAGSNDTVVAFFQAPCAAVLSKYNAPGDRLYSWIKDSVEGNGSLSVVHEDVPDMSIIYDSPYGNMTIRTDSRIVYCNYQSYLLSAMCEKGYFMNNSGVLQSIAGSAVCAREYSVAPQIADVAPASQPPQEKRIVETDAGAEYGINGEAVVAFFNNNPVFVKVMKNYHKVNLRVQDPAEGVDIRLKAMVDGGLITNVKEGEYPDADFTLIMPLDDALNIFNNADNITLANLLSFAKNVKTDPPEMLGKLIKQALAP